MTSLSSSSTTSLFSSLMNMFARCRPERNFKISSSLPVPIPMRGMLAEWTLDRNPLHIAILNTIGPTKPATLLLPLVGLIVDYLEVQKEQRGGIFGENEWAEHFGPVPQAPALPPSIEEIWQSPCPIFPGKKISETHMFVYIPTIVNELPLNLRSLGAFVKHYFPKTNAKIEGYGYLPSDIEETIGDTPIGNGCFVMMANHVLPESRGKCFDDQKNMVTDLARTALTAYEVPTTLEAAVCLLTRYVSSKQRLFTDIYTRCIEGSEGYRVVVGEFSSMGLNIGHSRPIDDKVAIAVLRKFF